MVSVPWRSVCAVSSTDVWMRAALTCSAMKLVNTTRKNSGTENCQPKPLDLSIHSMIPADTGPASSQYQLAPTSRKSGAASVSVPAVTSDHHPLLARRPNHLGSPPLGGSGRRSRRGAPTSYDLTW